MENKKELWLPVVSYEGLYEVSNYGNVRTLARLIKHSKSGYTRIHHGRILSPRKNIQRRGYVEISLEKDGLRKGCKVHRLVAEAFIPNPFSLPQVNHKDFNTSNNVLSNLEWCDPRYNVNYSKHRRKNMRGVRGRKISAFDMEGNHVGTYGSVRDAAMELNCFGQNICSVLNGKGKWVKGYTFKDAA